MNFLNSKFSPFICLLFFITLLLYVVAGTQITERRTLQKYGEPDRGCYWETNRHLEDLSVTTIRCGPDLPLHDVVDFILDASFLIHACSWLLLKGISSNPLLIPLLPLGAAYVAWALLTLCFPVFVLFRIFVKKYATAEKEIAGEIPDKPMDNSET